MSDINWTKWSAIAEIISSIAILVTLVFLVVETRQNSDLLIQNTTAILSNGQQNTLQSELEWLYKTIDYPELHTGTLPQFHDGLDKETQVRRITVASTMFRMRENSWLQYKIGAIDQETSEAYMNAFKGFYERDPYVKFAWEKQSDIMDQEFRNVVNEFINR